MARRTCAPVMPNGEGGERNGDGDAEASTDEDLSTPGDGDGDVQGSGDGDGDGDAGDGDAPPPCGEGTWDDDSDPATDCKGWTACAAGTFVKEQGTATADRECQACTAGTFSEQDNAEECAVWTSCPSGVAVEGSKTSDVECASTAVDVAVGDGFSCILREEGSVACWGRNDRGQLGRGDTLHSGIPSPVMVEGQNGLEPLSRVVQLSAGEASACALRENGTVWCWGSNSLGQVSLDSALAGSVVTAARRLEGVDNATRVAVGKEHACAILGDTTLTCWGMARRVFPDPGAEECWGDVGSLRNCNDVTYRFEYVDQGHEIARVTYFEPGSTREFLSDVSDIDAGASQSCAVRGDGTSVCLRGWFRSNGAWFALEEMTFAGIEAVSTGWDRTCWLMQDHTVTCGRHIHQQDPLLVDAHQVTLPDGVEVSEVEAGRDSLCLLMTDGSVWCQTEDAEGSLEGTIATPVAGLENIVAIAAAFAHSCAVDDEGRVFCWGDNQHGELGDYTIFQSTAPISVPNVDNAVALTSGSHHTCARLDNGKVKCWGKNDLGQLGIGGDIPMNPPLQLGISDVTQLNSKYEVTYATKEDGTLRVWGSDELGHFVHPTVDDVLNPTNVVSVAVGSSHACAIVQGGALTCWGVNTFGALGNDGRHEIKELGETPDLEPQYPPLAQDTYFEPFTLPLEHAATDVAAGEAHTCALIDGAVFCWGFNFDGQVGPNGSVYNGIPFEVPGLSSITHVEAGDNFSLGLSDSGVIYSWGANTLGQLGNGTAVVSDLSQVHGVDQAVSVAAGHFHACALNRDASIECWGLNDAGQLGSGALDAQALLPVAVPGLSPVQGVSAGAQHTCALHEDGTVSCWGSNEYYQLGHDRVSESAAPREIIWQ